VIRLILGLGNPGEEYAATRHNAGFRVVDELARRLGVRLDRVDCGALTALAPGEPPALPVLLAKPQTYMNRSGYAARCLVERHAIAPEAVLVVYDEVNLPLGRLRLRRSGSPAGHRGIESILESLRSDQVARLRIGIAPAAPASPASSALPASLAASASGNVGGEDLVEFVLAPFAPAEEEALAPVVRGAADACEVWLREGIDAAMNRFNGA
jgi:PTH1 family peptidyl-tRNA hydrolase